MRFKPAIWFPIAIILSAVNVAAVGFAARDAEPLHAGIHAALAVAFALWAQRMQRRSSGSETQADMQALGGEVDTLRQELAEAHERLDFAERVLAQQAATRRVDPQS
jgi:membrane protein implicated in regulation of membrane protease activity